MVKPGAAVIDIGINQITTAEARFRSLATWTPRR
jgi:5,10-methylene-tetrahydrofolate dehydrogenase/methenyl tetrahydrofolate cyclohydrolase